MNFKPCFIIPIYNHKKTIETTINALAKYGLKCFVINDGSDKETQTILDEIADSQPLVSLHHLPYNQGKGAAVIKGFELASVAHSHAFQIDADGQHDLQQVPIFLETAQKHPDSVICGQPNYNSSVPKMRLFARHITHFWVGIETLNLNPPDSMCGFRVYPLNACMEILRKSSIGTRMDFDIEIIVRLSWEQVPIKSLPVAVCYPEEGISHFHYLSDNIRISMMHTRLTFGMMRRFPSLIHRKLYSSSNNSSSKHWADFKERGTLGGIRALLWSYKTFGRLVFEIMLYPVISYFFLTSPKQRQASRSYLKQVVLTQQLKSYKGQKLINPSSFKHFVEFGQSIFDHLSSWMGNIKREDIQFDNSTEFIELSKSGKGGLILGAHLGSLDLCRAHIEPEEKIKLNVLVYTKHAIKFNSLLAKLNSTFNADLISVESVGPDTAILLREKIDNGELIVILGDRPSVNARNRVSQVDFLGKQASFPQGPFVLAHLLGCPVYLLFCLKEKSGYRVYFERFSERLHFPRPNRDKSIKEHVQRYAHRLEYYCLLEPYQWFNFFNLWDTDTTVND